MRARSRPARSPAPTGLRSTTSCCASRKISATLPPIRAARRSTSCADPVRLLALILATFVVALQFPLWFGKGGWLRVRDLQQQVDQQKAATAKLEARTRAFEA